MKILKFPSLLFGILFAQSAFADIRLDLIELPAGFKIEIYAEGVENARQMVRGEYGTIFAGTRRAGKLWAITDTDGDQLMPDGALLISDDAADVIYRVSYTP